MVNFYRRRYARQVFRRSRVMCAEKRGAGITTRKVLRFRQRRADRWLSTMSIFPRYLRETECFRCFESQRAVRHMPAVAREIDCHARQQRGRQCRKSTPLSIRWVLKDYVKAAQRGSKKSQSRPEDQDMDGRWSPCPVPTEYEALWLAALFALLMVLLAASVTVARASRVDE